MKRNIDAERQVIMAEVNRQPHRAARANRTPTVRAIDGPRHANFDPVALLAKAGLGKALVKVASGARVFAQGGDAIFYIQKGKIKNSASSPSRAKKPSLRSLDPGRARRPSLATIPYATGDRDCLA